MGSDPNSEGGITVTLKQKQSENFANDGSWIVFHGSVERVREDIGAAFGLEESAKELTLVELASNAKALFQGASVAGNKLGGTAVPADSSPAWEEARSSAGSTPASEPEAPPVNPLLAKVEEAVDVPALRDLWARNEAEFKASDELTAAWKAKGKALSEAAK